MFIEVKRNPNLVTVPQANNGSYQGAEFAIKTDAFGSYDEATKIKEEIFKVYRPGCDASTISFNKDISGGYWFDFVTDLPLLIQKEDETAWSSWSKDLYVESLGSISEPTFDYGNYGIDKYKAELHKTYGLKGVKAVNKVKLTKVGILVNQDLTITDIKFNKKSTIVFWSDDTKTVVTLKDNDVADPEAAVAQAIAKKLYGGTSGFHNAVNKHVREEANKIRDDISVTEKKLEKARKDPKKNKKKIATLIEKDDNLRTTLRTMGEKYYE